MKRDRDFLDELISQRALRNPNFPAMVEAAEERRRLLRRLTAERERLGLSQTEVAAAMGTSQSSVARLESLRGDVRISSLERYAATLGRRIEWRLAAAPERPHPRRRSAGNRAGR